MAIVKAAGQAFKDECKGYGRMPSSGIAVTGAGNLPCRHVIHINACLDLTTTIVRVLLEAEQLHDRSVAFPALGTGALRLTPLQAASTMFDAIKRFTVSYPTPKYLTLVKIVIFDMTIMESFRQCFLEQGSATGPDEQPVYSSSHRTSQGGVPQTQMQNLTVGPPSSGVQHTQRAPAGASDGNSAGSNSAGASSTTGRQADMQIRWMFVDGSTYRYCSEDMNCSFESAYLHREKSFEWTDMAGVKHRIYWNKLNDKMKARSIRRTVTFGKNISLL
ncbi:hypothetical protein NP493_636g03001 [Ridgeia piscesae]|uniref:Macro domain-containing protein n=1 Tax=Ridgeia piscesae TaxID=27915 RepID=A0AAD9KT56_RIDPI|nr:hypothetical protein NP493_636g03001 [Ridgeia piscesae]